jgi:hypothetical protein
MSDRFEWKKECIRILANLLFWLLPGLLVLGGWKAGFISVSTTVPKWLVSVLEAVLDLPAIAFVLTVSGILFLLLRRFGSTQSLARAVGEEVSRILYVAATYVLVAGAFLGLTGLLERQDVLNMMLVVPGCLLVGLLSAWAAQRFTR